MTEALAMYIGGRFLDNSAIPAKGIFVSTRLGVHVKIRLSSTPQELTDRVNPELTATVAMEAVGFQVPAPKTLIFQGLDSARNERGVGKSQGFGMS